MTLLGVVAYVVESGNLMARVLVAAVVLLAVSAVWRRLKG